MLIHGLLCATVLSTPDFLTATPRRVVADTAYNAASAQVPQGAFEFLDDSAALALTV